MQLKKTKTLIKKGKRLFSKMNKPSVNKFTAHCIQLLRIKHFEKLLVSTLVSVLLEQYKTRASKLLCLSRSKLYHPHLTHKIYLHNYQSSMTVLFHDQNFLLHILSTIVLFWKKRRKMTNFRKPLTTSFVITIRKKYSENVNSTRKL